MKKNEIVILLVSLGITAGFSALFGAAGSTIVGNFWGWFWITFVIQIIFFLAWNSYLLQQNKIAQLQEEYNDIEALSKLTVNLSCAYCSNKQRVPIQLNQKNTFKCDSCAQTNGVYMQFSATQLTTPIESVKIPIENKETVEFKVSQQ